MRKKSWTHALPIILIPGVLGIIPLFFMGYKDIFQKAGPLAGVFFGIAGLICGLGIFELLRCIFIEHKENRLLRHPDGATRLKAIVLNDNHGLSNASAIPLGVKNRVFIPIHYSYTDTQGKFVSKFSAKLYTPLEQQYLTDIGEFDILVKGNTSVIAEKLDEQIIADFYNNR